MNIHCPVCNSNEIIKSHIMASSRFEGYAYLEYFLEKNIVAKQKWLNSKQYECLNCGSGFYDQWLSVGEASNIFNIYKSNHQAGWDQFERLIKKNLNNYYLNWIEKISLKVFDRLGKVENYCEIGCPFSGFALLDIKNRSIEERRSIVKLLFRSKENGSFWLKVNHALKKISFHVFTLLMRNNNNDKEKDHLQNAQHIRKHFLIYDKRTNGWGISCCRFDQTCVSAALVSKLFHDTIYLDEFNSKCELIGCFNYFDHYDDPIGVLKRLMEISDNVLITVHCSCVSGYQHKIGLNIKFIDFINGKTNYKAELIDILYDEDKMTDFAFLVSRNEN